MSGIGGTNKLWMGETQNELRKLKFITKRNCNE